MREKRGEDWMDTGNSSIQIHPINVTEQMKRTVDVDTKQCYLIDSGVYGCEKQIIDELTDKDDKTAYARTKEIAAASESSPKYYSCLEPFASLLDHKKSYIRTRAFILCCSQARWDDAGKLKQLLPALMRLLHDPKPSVVRQCLSAAKEIVVFRPELSEQIKAELDEIDLSCYSDSMTGLIHADIDELRELIDETGKR